MAVEDSPLRRSQSDNDNIHLVFRISSVLANRWVLGMTLGPVVGALFAGIAIALSVEH